MSLNLLMRIAAQLDELNAKLDALLAREPVEEPPEVYTVDEFAAKAKVSPFTVRRWLSTGQLLGEKADVWSGAHREWRIKHEEWLRYRRQGLLPQRVIDRPRRQRSDKSTGD